MSHNARIHSRPGNPGRFSDGGRLQSGDPPPSPRRPRIRRDTLAGMLFILPNLTGFIVFSFFPIFFSLGMAFTNWNLKPAITLRFIGLKNFINLLGFEQPAGLAAGLVPLFLASIVLVLAGLVFTLNAMVSNARGLRVGGLMTGLAGGLLLAAALYGGFSEPLFISGLVLLVLALPQLLKDDQSWAPGPGALAQGALLLGVLMFLPTQGRVLEAIQPNDHRFWYFLYNTIYLMLGIPVSIAGSLLLALLLNENLFRGGRRGALASASLLVLGLVLGWLCFVLGLPNLGILLFVLFGIAAVGSLFGVVAFRTIFYLPTFTAGVALMILWKTLYNPETGPINMLLAQVFGLLSLDWSPPRWLNSMAWAKPSLIIMGIWTSVGGINMLLYLAGLSNIPGEMLESAEIDGAGPLMKFRYIIWPQLAPTTFFITTMAIIAGLQGGFDQAMVMTGGGPAGATTTLSFYIYRIAFIELDLGYAAAISWVLFALIFTLTLIHWKSGKHVDV